MTDTYYFLIRTRPNTQVATTHILRPLPDGGVQSFPDIDSNLGPERAAYLAWVAEGNSPLPWPPEA